MDHIKSASFCFFWLGAVAGAGAMGVGIWTLVDRAYISVMMGSETLTAAAWILALSGGIAIVAMFIADVGVCMPHNKVMWVYNVTQGLVFVCFITAAILAIVFKVHINSNDNQLKTEMWADLRDIYGVNLDNGRHKSITKSWDDTQKKLRCCAVDDENWRAYYNSEWYYEQGPIPEVLIKPYVPETCCGTELDWRYKDVVLCQTYYYGPPRYQGGEVNHALYYRGCFNPAKEMGNEQCDIIICIGIICGLLMILPPFLLGLWLVLSAIPKIDDIREGKKNEAEKMMYPTAEGVTNYAAPSYYS